MDNLLQNKSGLKIVDKDDQITMYSTERWGVGDFDCRSIVTIKDVESGKDIILYKGLPYCVEIFNPEYVHQYHHESLASMLAYIPTLEQCDITLSYEGTLLQIFYYGGKWYTTTRTNSDASNSKWASAKTSFKDTLFASLLKYVYSSENGDYKTVEDIYEARFRKDRMYCILVKSTMEERVVCIPSDNEILHVATVEMFNQCTNSSIVDYEDKIDDIPKPKKFKDYYEGINSVNYKYNQGLIIRCPVTGTVYKVIDPTYQAYSKLRNNEPNLKLRYLELRKYRNMREFNDFKKFTLELYPEKCDWFEEIEDEIFELARYIHGKYMDVYVNKTEDVERYFTAGTDKYPRWLDYVSEIHSYYVRDLKLAKRSYASSGKFYRDVMYGRRDKSIATTINKILDIIRQDWTSLKLNNALKWYQRVCASKNARENNRVEKSGEAIDRIIDQPIMDEMRDASQDVADVEIDDCFVVLDEYKDECKDNEHVCQENVENNCNIADSNNTVDSNLFNNFFQLDETNFGKIRGKRNIVSGV